MRQSVWERFAHLSRFELGLDLMHSNFCHLFQFCSINEAIPIPEIRKWFRPLINLPGTNLSNILNASLNSAELSWCSAWRQMFTLCNFARCSPASSSSPWTRQSRVSRFRWRRTQWQGSAPADWSETSWKRKRWSASDSNYGQLRLSTNHIMTCPFQDKMKKDLENEIHLVLGRVLPHRPHDWQQLFRWYCPTSILQTIVRDG